MNIRIVKNSSGINGEVLRNGKVLEKVSDQSEYENINSLKYYIYNLENNTKVEILPKVKKYDLGSITNLNLNSKYIYFFNCMNLLNGKTEINIIRYDYEEDECSTIYMFIDDINHYNGLKRMKLFVVNDLYIIVENEILRSNLKDTYEGYLDFELYLYSFKDNRRIEILDENLVNNGIAAMIPISDVSCALKTGFSLLKDKRYKYLEKNETSVEGISIINPAQLVSDIMLMKQNIVLDTMDQTFYNVTIPSIKVDGDYIIYSKVNIENHEEEVIFYNYITKKASCCVNRNVFEEKDMTKYNIINNIPYVRLENKDKTEFYNLLKNKTEISFEKETVEDVVNDLIITTSHKKTLFSGNASYINVYKYPQINLLHREKGVYTGNIATKQDYIYLLTR